MVAACAIQLKVIRSLVQQGADMEKTNNDGRTAFLLAAM